MQMADQEIRKIRIRAAELVDQGWCQGVQAQDEQGRQCSVAAPQAVRWCLSGAVARAAEEFGYRTTIVDGAYFGGAIDVLDTIVREELHGETTPEAWNDYICRTADEVAALLRGSR